MSLPAIPGVDDPDEPAPRAPWAPVHPGPPPGDGEASVAALLSGAAAALDAYDRLARNALAAQGLPTSDQDDDEVQRFLRALARFFAERPALSALAAGKVMGG